MTPNAIDDCAIVRHPSATDPASRSAIPVPKKTMVVRAGCASPLARREKQRQRRVVRARLTVNGKTSAKPVANVPMRGIRVRLCRAEGSKTLVFRTVFFRAKTVVHPRCRNASRGG